VQAFLDELPFVQHRLYSVRAVEDPFLTEVTPDGVPIDAATTVDLRIGSTKYVWVLPEFMLLGQEAPL